MSSVGHIVGKYFECFVHGRDGMRGMSAHDGDVDLAWSSDQERVFPEREFGGVDFDADGLRYWGSSLRGCDWIGRDLGGAD